MWWWRWWWWSRGWVALLNALPHLVVHAIRAVRHHDVLRQILTEILHGLGLARTGRAQRVTAAVEEHGRQKGEHAAVGERRDHQAPVVALVLVRVLEDAVGLLHDAGAKLALVLIVLEAQLAEPLEVLHVGAVRLDHALHHITVVNLHGNEGNRLVALELREVAAHKVGAAGDVADLLLLQLTHRIFVAAWGVGLVWASWARCWGGSASSSGGVAGRGAGRRAQTPFLSPPPSRPPPPTPPVPAR